MLQNKLIQSTCLENWFYLESEFSTPEGTKEDWLRIIAAIKRGAIHMHCSSRLAFDLHNNIYWFYSPRNSEHIIDGKYIEKDEIIDSIKSWEKVLEKSNEDLAHI